LKKYKTFSPNVTIEFESVRLHEGQIAISSFAAFDFDESMADPLTDGVDAVELAGPDDPTRVKFTGTRFLRLKCEDLVTIKYPPRGRTHLTK
jgi:hypothetical protein